MIQLSSPNALWLLGLVPVLILFLRWRWGKQRRDLNRFASSELVQKLLEGFSAPRKKWKAIFVVVAVGFISLALTRPQYGVREEILKRKGMDLVIVLDTSDSMLAEDIRPNRLRIAKREIGRLVDLLKGDRVALVPFSGDAFVQCPLTLDYGAVKMLLEEIDTNTVSLPGTNLGRAIEVAARCFVQEESKYKVMILITDGDDTVGTPDPMKVAQAAAEAGIRIYTIGIGSREGVPIPIRDASGQLLGYKENKQGEKVVSPLNEKLLQDIARTTDGLYSRATSEHLELQQIYDDIHELEQKELSASIRLSGIDRYQYVLFPALLLLILEPLISAKSATSARTLKEKP